MQTGIKESEGKLFYEIDWSFIEDMAIRMSSNKGDKYPVFNWKNQIDVKELNSALIRHFIEVQKENYSDEQELGHLIALACNSMMMVYQLKHYGNKNVL